MRRRVWTSITAFVLAAALGAPARPAVADEIVSFASARYLVGSLQQRFARERGEAIVRPPPDTIRGYLSKPEGNGPFPAIVHLHGCGGLTSERRRHDAEQFANWGYVTLMVDSFTTRGISDDCLGEQTISRSADAWGALIYLSMLPYIDARRIALVGYSQGGKVALQIASAQPARIFDVPRDLTFRAAVAYYPSCGAAMDKLAIPVLVLIGGNDDWTPATGCDRLLRRFDSSGAPIKITVFPDAYHDFDSGAIRGTIRYFGHWLRYDPEAAALAAGQTRDFLAKELGQQRLP
jgi:dienelactone hydrolase